MPLTDSWPPVTPETVSFLISQMCSGKALGLDLIPVDLLENNLV